MEQLRVAFGLAARDALCAAFDAAHSTIDAEFYSISDPKVIASINNAAARHVKVSLYVEGDTSRYYHKQANGRAPGEDTYEASLVSKLRQEFAEDVHVIVKTDPDVLLHAKAAVVDGAAAFIATANPTSSGFASPGGVLVTDSSPRDVAAVEASIAGIAATEGDYVVSGPANLMRSRVDHLLDSNADLRVAAEDLSDRKIVDEFAARKAAGRDDRILIDANGRVSRSETLAIARLHRAGVEVRSLTRDHMHEKYIDDGDEIYVGSANLTRNGLDEAREIGVIAPAEAFGSDAFALRANFDRNWTRAVPL